MHTLIAHIIDAGLFNAAKIIVVNVDDDHKSIINT